jgi:hypothetical protein
MIFCLVYKVSRKSSFIQSKPHFQPISIELHKPKRVLTYRPPQNPIHGYFILNKKKYVLMYLKYVLFT